MRIIAGTHRGRKLIPPEGDDIRPTSDRVRESLFSILGDIEDIVIIDGFAGTGALGMEALSRGAKKVYFFDTSKSAANLVKANLEELGLASSSRVFHGSIKRNISLITIPSHLVFLDPPYKKNLIPPALEALAASQALADGALLVLEHFKSEDISIPQYYEKEDERRYGKTTLSFLRFSKPSSQS